MDTGISILILVGRIMSRWDRKDMGYINLYSKGGIVIMTLAFLGVMYIINLISYSVGGLLR